MFSAKLRWFDWLIFLIPTFFFVIWVAVLGWVWVCSGTVTCDEKIFMKGKLDLSNHFVQPGMIFEVMAPMIALGAFLFLPPSNYIRPFLRVALLVYPNSIFLGVLVLLVQDILADVF